MQRLTAYVSGNLDRLDDGIEILKDLLKGVNSIEVAVKSGFQDLGQKMDFMLEKQDIMLEKQDVTIGEIQGLR